MAEHIRQRHRLDDADPARGRNGGDEFGVAAGVHRAADDWKTDARLGGEPGGRLHLQSVGESSLFMNGNSTENVVEKLMIMNISRCCISFCDLISSRRI